MEIKDLVTSPLAFAFLAAGSVTLLTACIDGSDSNSGGTPAANGATTAGTAADYAGPGSRWDVSLDGAGVFTITMRKSASTPVVMDLGGSYEELDSGFLKLTIESVTADAGIDAPAVGDAGYALSVPGYVFVLKPLDAGSDQMIPMVASGQCPSADMDANWVVVNVEDGMTISADAGDLLGTFHFDAATGTPSLPGRYTLNQTPLQSVTMSGGNCDAGTMTVDGAEMFLTTNGGAIVRPGADTPDDDSDDTFIFGFAQETIGDIAAIEADYAGLLFDGSANSGEQIVPVSIRCSADGVCSGNIVTDIEANTLSAEGVTIRLTTVDNPGDGFITGTISNDTPGSVETQLACMANIDAQGTGKNIMSCVGLSPGGGNELFNVLLVSK